MLSSLKRALFAGLTVCLLASACADSPWAKNLERSLAADPSLEDGSLFGSSPNPDQSPSVSSSLPEDFPGEIPRYPNAELLTATLPDRNSPDLASSEIETTQTQWVTSDSIEQVQQFYWEQFQTAGWQLVEPTSSENGSESNADPIVAERDGLQVTVAPSASGDQATANNATEFTISYQFTDNASIAQSPAGDRDLASIPQPGDPAFIGPVPPDSWSSATTSPSASSTTSGSSGYTDLDQAPAELRSYVTDLAELGVLSLQPGGANGNKAATGGEFQPNATITRREYARWLVAANNQIYANQPSRQIRLGISTDQPAFQDVPTSDADFGAIQGLANAGLIPSSLSGDATVVTFRPDAPLTREDLLRWKVPVDLRQALPNATIESVQQAWGFQDAARIDPNALRAVLADYQNGDLSNIRRAFGYTTLFQPDKPVTRAEAAAVLWFFGNQGDGLSAKDALQTNQQTDQSIDPPTSRSTTPPIDLPSPINQ